MSYMRFGAMIMTSTLIMFGLMYFNTFEWAHVRYSQTRAWMAVLMGATMSVVMLGFMWSHYGEKKKNVTIIITSLILVVMSIWLVRSQTTVDDVSYMAAMIPHHSIAIMTSERAQIRDPRVRQLADGIIRTQVKEIGEMNALITKRKENPPSQASPILSSSRGRGAPPPDPE